MRVVMNIPASRACLTGALEGLTGVNYAVLSRESLPPIYESGVRYKAEPKRLSGKREEQWQTAEQCYRKKHGDCEDLAAWRAAELRQQGVPARAVVLRSGPRTFHAVVLWPDGTIEDPSAQLGMKRRRR